MSCYHPIGNVDGVAGVAAAVPVVVAVVLLQKVVAVAGAYGGVGLCSCALRVVNTLLHVAVVVGYGADAFDIRYV